MGAISPQFSHFKMNMSPRLSNNGKYEPRKVLRYVSKERTVTKIQSEGKGIMKKQLVIIGILPSITA